MVDNYDKYKALLIIIKGDDNNGDSWIVPKPVYNIRIPLYVSSKNNEPANDGGGYSVAYHGYIVNGVLNNNYVQFSGWDGIKIQVYGLN